MENKSKKEQTEKAAEQPKPTYEQLNNYCTQLYNQNRQLAAKLQELNMSNLMRRLDYLFLVVQNKEAFKGEFYDTCVEEIKEALTIRKDDTKAEEKSDKK